MKNWVKENFFKSLASQARDLSLEEIEELTHQALDFVAQLHSFQAHSLVKSLPESQDPKEDEELHFFLKGFAPFAALSEIEFSLILSIAQMVELKEGKNFIEQNQPITGLFVLYEQVEARVSGGQAVAFRRSGIFGEGLLQGINQKSFFNIAPIVDCEAIFLPIKDLWGLLPSLQGFFIDLCLEVQTSQVQDLLFGNKRLLIAGEEVRIAQEALDEVGQISFLLDERGEIEGGISEKAALVFGQEDLIGRSFADLILKNDRIALKAYYRALRLLFEEEEQNYGTEVALLPQEITFSGRKFLLHYNPTLDSSGLVLSLFVRMEDISQNTEQREEELAQEIKEVVLQRIQADGSGYLKLLEAGQNIIQGAFNLLAQVASGKWDKERVKDDFLILHGVQSLSVPFGLQGVTEAADQLELAMEVLWSSGESVNLERAVATFESSMNYAISLKNTFGEAHFEMLQGVHFTSKEYDQVFSLCVSEDHEPLKKKLLAKVYSCATNVTEGWEEDIAFLSHKEGKQVDLSIEVEEGLQLRKSQVKLLNFELRHLYRNAIDHGIETPQKRNATNKGVSGKLIIRLRTSGNCLSFSIRDDGQGLNPYKLGQLARDNRAMDKDLVESYILRGEEWRLLFMPEFNGTDNENGLAAVKVMVENLSGTISLVSEPGQGCQITVKLPL